MAKCGPGGPSSDFRRVKSAPTAPGSHSTFAGQSPPRRPRAATVLSPGEAKPRAAPGAAPGRLSPGEVRPRAARAKPRPRALIGSFSPGARRIANLSTRTLKKLLKRSQRSSKLPRTMLFRRGKKSETWRALGDEGPGRKKPPVPGASPPTAPGPPQTRPATRPGTACCRRPRPSPPNDHSLSPRRRAEGPRKKERRKAPCPAHHHFTHHRSAR